MDGLLSESGERQVLYGTPGPFPRVSIRPVGNFFATSVGGLALDTDALRAPDRYQFGDQQNGCVNRIDPASCYR